MKTLARVLLAALACLAPARPCRAYAGLSSRDLLPTRAPAQARRLVAEGARQLRAKQYSTAIAALERAVQADGYSAEAFLQLGNAYYQRAYQNGTPERADKDDAQAAVDAFRTALALDPAGRVVAQRYLVHHGLGQCYDALGRYPEALAAFRDAAQTSPANPMPHLYVANLRLRMGDPAMAAANFETSVRRAYRGRRLSALLRLLQSDESYSALLALPSSQATLRAYEGAAIGALTGAEAAERSEAAREAAPIARAEEPTREIPGPRIPGAAEIRDSLKGAAAAEDRAAAPAPSKDPEVYRLLDQANTAFAAQRLGDAVNYYRATLESDATRGALDSVQKSLVFERMGTAYRLQGRTGEAVRSLELAVARMPQNSAAQYQLSLCFATEGQSAKALSALNRALESAATLPELRKTVLLARTDPELEGVRELPRFQEILDSHARRMSGGR